MLLALIAVLSATIALVGHYLAERRQAELMRELHSNGRKLDVIQNGHATAQGEMVSGK